jgi:hypothetical protein
MELAELITSVQRMKQLNHEAYLELVQFTKEYAEKQNAVLKKAGVDEVLYICKDCEIEIVDKYGDCSCKIPVCAQCFAPLEGKWLHCPDDNAGYCVDCGERLLEGDDYEEGAE